MFTAQDFLLVYVFLSVNRNSSCSTYWQLNFQTVITRFLILECTNDLLGVDCWWGLDLLCTFVRGFNRMELGLEFVNDVVTPIFNENSGSACCRRTIL